MRFIGNERVFYPLSLMYRGDQMLVEAHGGFFFSVNMAIRRSVLIQAGGFHPEATGTLWVGDGETGLYRELWRRQLPIAYVPGAIAYHHIPPDRLTLKYLKHRMRNEGAAEVFARYHGAIPDRLTLIRNALSIALRSLPFWIASRLVARATRPLAVRIHVRAAQSWSEFRNVLRVLLDDGFRQLLARERWIEPARQDET
jgi:hypothetical protein